MFTKHLLSIISLFIAFFVLVPLAVMLSGPFRHLSDDFTAAPAAVYAFLYSIAFVLIPSLIYSFNSKTIRIYFFIGLTLLCGIAFLELNSPTYSKHPVGSSIFPFFAILGGLLSYYIVVSKFKLLLGSNEKENL